MFGINFYKGDPTNYVFKYVDGKVVRQGTGISFFFLGFNTTIASVPTKTIDANFVFNEITKNFQTLTVQGQITYRISDPQKTVSILDFSITPPYYAYRSDDPAKLSQRIVNIVQLATRAEIQQLALEEAVQRSEAISRTVLEKAKADPYLASIGAECMSVHFLGVTPTPEMSKALEAEYREKLQKKADEAIYSRRAAAVEQERKIKENELASQITIEKGRQQLVELNGSNRIKEAEFAAKASEMELGPYRATDAKTLLAMGIRSLGENAAKIGHLNITPDLLASILGEKK